MTDIMNESDFPHEDSPTHTPIDYGGHGLRSSGFATPDPVIVPERVATRLVDAVVQGEPDAGHTEWLVPERDSGYLVGIPVLSLTFGSADLIDPVAVVAWVTRVNHHGAPLTVGSWVNPDTGAVCFDASSWHEGSEDAWQAVWERGEHSAWDIANARSRRGDSYVDFEKS